MSSSSTQKKPMRHRPKNPERRTKEERDALEKVLEDQRKVQDAAAQAAKAEAIREKARLDRLYGRVDRGGGRGRGAPIYRPTRGRGGFMGTRPDVSHVIEPPEPKAPDTEVKQPTKTRKSRASTTRAKDAKPKNEPAIKTDPDGDVHMAGSSGSAKIQFDGGYISSDPDEGAEGPRQDVNTMFFPGSGVLMPYQSSDENSSSEDDDDEPVRAPGTAKFRGEQTAAPLGSTLVNSHLPIRIPRRRHEDRKILINRDSNFLGNKETRKYIDDSALDLTKSDGLATNSKRQGKTRSKDVQFVSESKTFRGVYRDENNVDESIPLKHELDREPASGGGGSANLPEPTAAGDASSDAEIIDGEAPSYSDNKAKGKQRSKLDPSVGPKYATTEELLEWQIRRDELQEIRRELGPQPATKEPKSKFAKAQKEAPKSAQEIDIRANNVYLFQLPPILPDLIAGTAVKDEPESPELSQAGSVKKAQANVTAEDEAKLKGIDISPLAQATGVRKPAMESGRIGKLQVHESGRTTLSWGGMPMEVSMGMSASFLQTAVLANVEPKEDGAVNNQYAGDVMSFGQVRGKFVVTPDWKEMLS